MPNLCTAWMRCKNHIQISRDVIAEARLLRAGGSIPITNINNVKALTLSYTTYPVNPSYVKLL